MKALVYDLNAPRIIASKLLGCISPTAYTGRFAALQYREIPDVGLPGDDWVLIKTRLCGICGSDYKQIFAIGNWDNPMTALISFPQILGHEVVGTIRAGWTSRNRPSAGRARGTQSLALLPSAGHHGALCRLRGG